MKLCTLTLLASDPMLDAPLKLVGHANVQPPVPFCVMMKVIVAPADAFETELEVTFPVSVIAKLPPALASNVGVAEKLCAMRDGKSAGTMSRAVIGPFELPVAGPAKNECAA